jgi:hypothetical protein
MLIVLVRPVDLGQALAQSSTSNFSLGYGFEGYPLYYYQGQMGVELGQGQFVQGAVYVTWHNGFSSAVQLEACFCSPSNTVYNLDLGGPFVDLATTSLTPVYTGSQTETGGNSAVFWVVTTPTTPPGTYWLTVTGLSGQFEDQIPMPVTVSSSPSNTTVTYTASTTSTGSVVVTSTIQLTQYIGSTATSFATVPVYSTSTLTTMTTGTQTSTLFVTNSFATTSMIVQTSSSTAIVTSAIPSYVTESLTSTSISVLPETSIITSTTGVAVSTVTSTSQTTVPLYILSDPTQLWILSALFLIIAGALLFRFKSRIIRKPVTCPKCGSLNPAYAERFCVKCGEPLSTGGYGKPD